MGSLQIAVTGAMPPSDCLPLITINSYDTGSIPAPPTNTTKMKTSEKQLYNALAYLVLFGKQLKNTLEELTFAIEKSESLLIAHNLKSTRLKK